jgi:hypothetical protein
MVCDYINKIDKIVHYIENIIWKDKWHGMMGECHPQGPGC